MYSNTTTLSNTALKHTGKQLKIRLPLLKITFNYSLVAATTEKVSVQSFFETQLTLTNTASLGATALQ
jgi:hypothetical protein